MKHTYKTLDALRGIAALAVVIFHSKRLLGWSALPSGYLAVDFFFVLSGFVIAHAYDSRLRGTMSAPQFVWHRLLRFYPLYFAGFAVGLAYEIGLVATGNSVAIPSLTLLAAAAAGLIFMPFPFAQREGNIFALNVPSWSLFYELAVNALYAFFFRWMSTRIVVAIAAVNAVIFGCLIIIQGTGDFGALADQSLIAIPRTIFSFSAGLLIHRLNIASLQVPKVLIFGMLVVPMMLPVSAGNTIVFVFLISPLLVTLAAATEPSPRSQRAFEFFGLISFPIYAVHRPVLAFAQTFADRLSFSPAATLAITMTFLVVVSPALDAYYDRPLRKWLSAATKTWSARLGRDKLTLGTSGSTLLAVPSAVPVIETPSTTASASDDEASLA
jgi:peptidoglycan/LPS O-acetylase OafA/YrhL